GGGGGIGGGRKRRGPSRWRRDLPRRRRWAWPFQACPCRRRRSRALRSRAFLANHPRPMLAALADNNPVTLIEEITAAIADAMRQHDQIRLSTLRMLKAALMNRE